MKALFLRGLAQVYLAVVKIRLWLYQSGALRSRTLSSPVVCIGNLSMGGSGKTPIVIETVRILQKLGKKPSVISRGYGGTRSGQRPCVVSDGKHINLSAAESGDEPRMIAEMCPGVPVVICQNRYEAGQWAIAQFGSDTLVMDDGYQHIQLKRNLNILVFDGTRAIETLRLFPEGTLREPLSHGNRAQAFILSKCNVSDGTKENIQRLKELYKTKNIFQANLIINDIRRLTDGASVRTASLKEKRVLCFSAIGNPGAFRRLVETELKATVVRDVIYRDHSVFTEKDVERGRKILAETGGAHILVTDKDAVKIGDWIHGDPSWLVVSVAVGFSNEDRETYIGLLREL